MSINEMILNKLNDLGVVVKWVDKGKNGGFVFNIEFNSDWIDDSGKVSDIKFDVEGREFRLVGGLEGKKYKDSVQKIENGKVVKVDEWKEVNSNYIRIVESSDVDVLSRMNDLSQFKYVILWCICRCSLSMYIPRYF